MVKLLKQLARLIKWAIFGVFSIMIIAVVVQVFARTFMPQPPIWTEEASRVTLLYIMGLGVGASVLTGDLVNVDLALMIMPKPMRRFCTLLSAIFLAEVPQWYYYVGIALIFNGIWMTTRKA